MLLILALADLLESRTVKKAEHISDQRRRRPHVQAAELYLDADAARFAIAVV